MMQAFWGMLLIVAAILSGAAYRRLSQDHDEMTSNEES